VFPENIIRKGMMFRWKQIKGLPYQADETQYYNLLNNYIAKDKVKRRIDVSGEGQNDLRPGIFVPSNSWNCSNARRSSTYGARRAPQYGLLMKQPLVPILNLHLIDGWNARGNLANMKPTEAIQMDNIFPGVQTVEIRKGSIDWATAAPATIHSLLPYSGLTTNKLFAATAAGIYDITAGGVFGAAAVVCTMGFGKA
jgi:hypothetical protein